MMRNIENARAVVLKLCNSLQNKDMKSFESCFRIDDDNWKFINVLPGGEIVRNVRELIDIHLLFFRSENSSFEPVSGSLKFNDRSFLYELDGGGICQFIVSAKVVKPEQLLKKQSKKNMKLITINNILNFTLIFCDEFESWYIASITNTIIDS